MGRAGHAHPSQARFRRGPGRRFPRLRPGPRRRRGRRPGQGARRHHRLGHRGVPDLRGRRADGRLPAMERARDWSVAKFKELGFENIKVEAFTTPAWSRGAESAEVVGPWPHKLAILGLGNSSPTPAGGLTAPIVVFKSYQAMLDQPAGALTGKIAVVTQAMGRTQDGSSYGAVGVQRRAGAAEAAKRGAVGYLIRSISTDDTRLPHTGGGAPGGIPAAALSPPDAELLENLA